MKEYTLEIIIRFNKNFSCTCYSRTCDFYSFDEACIELNTLIHFHVKPYQHFVARVISSHGKCLRKIIG